MAASDPQFESLLRYLKEDRGFDFTGYKRASLMRRVGRAMADVGVDGFEDYQDYLQVHPEEFTSLFNTILINVTGFFRDGEAWSYLRSDILPEFLERRVNQPIRVWSAGCASGEEAYSLAMTLADALGVEEFRQRVKIYATDVDEDALSFARQASYSDRELRGLMPEQVEGFFESNGTRHMFRKDLRRSVIFGRNDLVQDAPISHVDLLLCRNTLMYFNAETQSQMIQRLHFALKPDGVLFLGKAEMLLSHANLFTPIDVKRRFFRRAGTRSARDRRLVVGPALADLPGDREHDFGPVKAVAMQSTPVAQVVVDAGGRLAMGNHRAETLFGLTARDVGRPFQDLELSYRPLELRSYMEHAARDRRTVWAREVEWQRAGTDPASLDVQVVPLFDEAAYLGCMIVFNDVTRFRALQVELEYSNRQLETAYEEVQSTNEELETTNEELQSTVEELETTNEELQSTNEELETMNEELQSMNDELQSSNDELRERTTEVSDLNRFMEAVLGSLQAGVAVVDHDLCVLAWNKRAADLWGVREDEAMGQHLLNLDIGLPVDQLHPLLRRQLSGTDGEPEMALDAVNRRGRSIKVRVTVTPLKSDTDEISGAILVMDPDGS